MSKFPTVIVEKIDNKAIIPCKPKSYFDAGWDVYSLERVVIPAGGDALLSTGLRMAIPNNYCIQVNPRSGKATRDKLVIGARIIDAPYRGELKIHIINFGKEEVEISPNDPCAQLLILRTEGMIMEGVIENRHTERGEDGFGSSNSDLIKIAKEARDKVLKIPESGIIAGFGMDSECTNSITVDKVSIRNRNDSLDKAEVKEFDSQQWPVIGELNVSHQGFFATKDNSTKSIEVAEAVSTLAVLRERIERGDLKGTPRELTAFSDALRKIINHL